MYRYVIKRILLLIPIMIAVSFVVYFIVDLAPGDSIDAIYGNELSIEQKDALREELGYNDPLVVRYARYMGKLLTGDMGMSTSFHEPVMQLYFNRFPATLQLAFWGIIIALLIAIPLGIIAAVHQNTFIDSASMVLGLLGMSMPNFWFGLLMVILFALTLGWLPSQGMGEGFIPLIKSLVLPAVTLGTGAAAMITRMTRSSMLEVIRQDYIDTARAKGVSDKKITTRHMLKNAMIPIITAVGLQFGTLLGGAMLTETVFSWPGLGRLMVDSIKSKDIPMVLGSVIFLAIMFTVVNLAVDIIYAFVDPRIKSQYKRK